MDRIINILGKTIIVFLVLITGYWGHYLYKYEISEYFKDRKLKEYHETHGYSDVTRGGYAQPSHDSIPNTLRPDTLKKW